MAGTYNITIEQGADFDLLMTWKDAAGTPIDLTGFSARMQCRASLADATLLLDLTTANGHIVLGGTAGTIRLLLTAAETAALTWTRGIYDLELVSSAGIVTRLLSGSIVVSPEVTR